ncbi:hypothetical protein CCR75_001992 [Bremia lactucae]|uniref:Uncharacterized protein n=1 Tax=Bremia lactucae TaxID=4779 RepID=A0A976IMA9_BRELC|nr:hypothetical protein CCR75_001992 [Bremia lactucae]
MSRQSKAPRDMSTMGSLIYGSGENQSSYLDEHKARRPQSQIPQLNNSDLETPDTEAVEESCDVKSSAFKEFCGRVPEGPSSDPQNRLQQTQPVATARRIDSPESRSDYFANGMGGQHGEKNIQRRTRRMFDPPSGSSSFRLG